MFTRTTAASLMLGLSVLATHGTDVAAEQNGVPQDIQARMYRMQAQQNRNAGHLRDTSAAAADGIDEASDQGSVGTSGRLDVSGYDQLDGGTGNLTIGDFSHADNTGLREVNILVDGDIINWNNSR